MNEMFQARDPTLKELPKFLTTAKDALDWYIKQPGYDRGLAMNARDELTHFKIIGEFSKDGKKYIARVLGRYAKSLGG